LSGENTAQEGDVNSELLLQLLTEYVKRRKSGSRPIGKDALMAFLKQKDVPLKDINEVYKELESMLTDYATLTKENPELRDLVVLFSQIALHIQQLGDIRLELEKLQHQMDKCADGKEKERLTALLATRSREVADKEAEMEELNRDFEASRNAMLARIAELEEELRRKGEDFEVMEGKRNECLQEVARLKALIAGLEGRLDALKGVLDEANEELAAKKQRISELEAELAAAEKEAAKVPGMEAEIARLTAELAAAQGEASKVPGLEAELAALRAQLAAAQGEANKVPGLEAELAALRAQLAAAQGEANKVPGLEAELAAAEAQANKVPGLEAELAAAQVEARKVPALEAELAALRARLAAADVDARKVPGLEAELAALRARLAAAEVEARKVPGLEAQLAASEVEARKVPGLEQQLQELRAQLAAAQGEARRAGDGLGAELAALRARFAVVNPEAEKVPGLKAELASLRAQLAEAIARAKEAEESLRRCGEENERLRAENERLRRAVEDCERQKAELEAAAAAAAAPPAPPSSLVASPPPAAKAPPKLKKSTLKLIAGDIDELGPICFYVFFKTYLYHDFEGSSITATSYDIHGQIISTKRTLRRIYDTKEFINMLYPKIFEQKRGGPPRGKETEYSAEWKNTALWFMFHLIRRIGELYLGVKGVQVPKSLVEPATKINFDSVDKTEIKDYIIILFNELSTFLGIVDAASIRSNLLKKSGNLQRSLQDTVQQLYAALQSFNLTTPESILVGIENTCMRGLLRQLEEEAAGPKEGGRAPRRPQIGGGRKTSIKSLSQGMLLLFLVQLRKSNQLKSAKEVQDLVNKAGKALDSIGQYELVLTILQEIVGNINIHTEEGYTYVKLGSLKEEKANALVESYNQVFSKSDSKMFKTLGTVGAVGSFHASAPEEFEEVLGKGPFCLVLVEDKERGEGKEETPLHGVSDEYQVVLEEKERNVLEDNGGIPLGGVIFLYLVCLNELYCDSSDEECIRPTV
jgi:regulator of replication initiation timing